MAAFLSGYSTRRRLTIAPAGKVDAVLTNFPVYVRLTSANFDFARSLATGFDVRFTAADGTTLLDFERERHDNVALRADYMVRLPSVSATVNTEFFIYFRTEATADGANPTAVWDVNTMGRWSLSENPAGTAPQMRNSTANNNHGTTHGAMTAGQSVEGQVGRALSFDGVNDRVNIPDTAKGGASVTASGFIRLSTLTYQHIYTESDMNSMALAVNADGSLVLLNETTTTVHASFSSTPGLISIGAWFHVTYSFNHITGRLEGYINGNRVIDVHRGGNQRYWNRSNNVIGVYLGQNLVTTSFHLHGQIDEFSISNIARSPAWIRADFHSTNDTLLTYGAQEIFRIFSVISEGIATIPRIKTLFRLLAVIGEGIAILSYGRVKTIILSVIAEGVAILSYAKIRGFLITTIAEGVARVIMPPFYRDKFIKQDNVYQDKYNKQNNVYQDKFTKQDNIYQDKYFK